MNAKAAVNSGLDERGNYNEHGDLHVQGEKFETLVPRIKTHLHQTFSDYKFAIERETFAGGRKLRIKIISGPEGLADQQVRDDLLARVKKQVERFNRSNGNIYQDSSFTSFYNDVTVDGRYYSDHADVSEETNISRTMKLAAFKKKIKAGDKITLISTNNKFSKRLLNVEREIFKVRSADMIIIDDQGKKSYFPFPRAAEFACDGEKIRVCDADEYNPDAYRLYSWTSI